LISGFEFDQNLKKKAVADALEQVHAPFGYVLFWALCGLRAG
jgi:hypothetical protein